MKDINLKAALDAWSDKCLLLESALEEARAALQHREAELSGAWAQVRELTECVKRSTEYRQGNPAFESAVPRDVSTQEPVKRVQPCYRGNDWCPVGCCSHFERTRNDWPVE